MPTKMFVQTRRAPAQI